MPILYHAPSHVTYGLHDESTLHDDVERPDHSTFFWFVGADDRQDEAVDEYELLYWDTTDFISLSSLARSPYWRQEDILDDYASTAGFCRQRASASALPHSRLRHLLAPWPPPLSAAYFLLFVWYIKILGLALQVSHLKIIWDILFH